MQKIAGLLGEDSNLSRIGRAFDLMGIATDEITAFKKRFPKQHAVIHEAFAVLMPGDLVTTGDDLYRSHVRELLTRVQQGADVTPGTDAECCLCFMRVSLKAPPTAAVARAYGECFIRALPYKADGMRDMGRESYPGEVAEIVAVMRKKIGAAVGRGKKAKAA